MNQASILDLYKGVPDLLPDMVGQPPDMVGSGTLIVPLELVKTTGFGANLKKMSLAIERRAKNVD